MDGWFDSIPDFPLPHFSHDTGGDPIAIAQQIRAQLAASIVVVGVPGINGYVSPIDYIELEAIAGRPDFVFNVTQIDKIGVIKQDLTNALHCTNTPCKLCERRPTSSGNNQSRENLTF